MDAEIFWEKVNQRLTELEKTKEWLCDKVGLNYGSLRNRIHLGRMPGFDDAMKILKALDFTMEGFEAYPGIAKNDVLNLPVYEQAFSAGRGQEFGDSSEIIEEI